VDGCDEVALWLLPGDVECEAPVEYPVEWLVVERWVTDEDVWLLLFDPEWLELLLPLGPAKAGWEGGAQGQAESSWRGLYNGL
jgi:hypothetical protein